MLFSAAKKSKKNGLRTVDLFCGCGGLSLGLENAGFNVVCGLDNWTEALDVYRKNFSHSVRNIDLSNMEKSAEVVSEYTPDVVVGGPPCQDFSQAGKRKEVGRASLTIAFAEIVVRVRPKIFIMENVDQLTKSESFKKAREIFKKNQYGLTVELLDASLCGVPQKRRRYFVIGILGEQDDVLQRRLHDGLSEKPMTMRKYFGDTLGTEYYYRHPWSYARRAIYNLDEPSPTIRGVNRPIPFGYPGHHMDATDDLSAVRPLTIIERGQVQTFPSDFIWMGTKTNVEQIIGNAVPVKLAEYVGSALLRHLKEYGTEYMANTKAIFPVKECKYDKVIASIG